jgi:hypothetical protein
MISQKHTESGVRSEMLTIPELEQSKAYMREIDNLQIKHGGTL